MSTEPAPMQIENEAEVRANAEAVLPQLQEQKQKTIGWLCGSVVAFDAAGLAISLTMIDKLAYPKLTAGAYLAALSLCLATAALYVYGVSESWDKIDQWLDQLKIPVEKRDAEEFLKSIEISKGATLDIMPAIKVGFLAAVASLFATITFAFNFEAVDKSNRARCLAIQRDMLSAHPRRSDGPDLFQALGCRPQGAGGVSAPPTDRERKAGHPLPWGGYPPSK